jgi:hypothetical protein
MMDEVARVAFGVGAEIEHDDVVVAQGRQQRGERRPVDPRHRAQRQLGNRHQGAGVAATDRGAGIARLHRVDRHAHRRGLGAAQGLAGFVVAGDDVVGMEDLGRRPQVRVAFERFLDPHLVAAEQELEAIMLAAGQSRAFDHDAHADIAAHRVDSDTRQSHDLRSSWTVLKTDGDDLAAVVVAAGVAEVVRALQFAAVAAFVEGFDLQRVVATAHAPAGGRRFSLGDSHFGTCSCKYDFDVKRPSPAGGSASAKARL